MKIALVVINANRTGGTARAVVEVAERLALDHTVDLVCRKAESVATDKVRVRHVVGPGWPAVADFATFRAASEPLLRTGGYDVIHSAGPNSALADVYTVQQVHAEKREVESVRASNGAASLPRRVTRALYDRAVLAAERRDYVHVGPRGPRRFLPVSKGTAGELARRYGLGDESISVVPNAADLHHFSPRHRSEHRGDVRKTHGLAEGDFVLVFSGGDWERKGLSIAIDAVALAVDPSVKLLVVGDDPLRDRWFKRAEKPDAAGRVVFAGSRRDIHRYYVAADAMLFPTSYEAFSLATIEAAASGIPVLMPRVSGAEELVGRGEAGILISRDPREVAATLDLLASDRELCAAMGDSARKHVERQFNWDAVAAATEEAYEHVLACRRSR